MSIFPAKWMLLDRYPASAYLQSYHGPVAILLAEHDSVVPNRFGRELYEAYQGPKKFWMTPGADHNDLINQPTERWAQILEFWRQNESRPPTTR
jgi:fermentation-respiration switch protein FrsA (DUF1100 family)